MSLDAALALDAVTLTFGDVRALSNVNLNVDRGEALAVVGKSGSGKSSLLKVAGGLTNPTSGDIHSAGRNITSMTETQKSAHRAGSVGFVFQDYNLVEHLTAIQNVQLAWMLRQKGTTPEEALRAVGLGRRATHRPSELSGGEQQRVSIARAICGGPELVFADEPTGALDTESSERVMDLLLSLHLQTDITLVVVTHDVAVSNMFPREIRLAAGSVIGDGAPS